jgi:hypothetical protein
LTAAGSSIINLDPKVLGLETSSVTEVLKEVANLNETNSTETSIKEKNATIDNNTSMATH